MALVYLDTGVFIRGFELAQPEAGDVRAFFGVLKTKPQVALTSELTIAELLAPIKTSHAMSIEERRALYLLLFDDGNFIALQPIERAILLKTASLRQAHPQRLSDAIHMATTLNTGCRFFMSPDRDARRLPFPLEWVEPNAAGIGTVMDALGG